MSLPRQRRVIPVLVALAVVALTLVAANRLIHPDPLPPQPGGDPAPAKPAHQAGHGPVVLGTVAAAPLAHYGLPVTLSAGKVRRVIDENADVQPGTILVEFDDTLAKLDLDRAEAAVKAAEATVLKAKVEETLFPFDVALQEIAVKAATEEYASAFEALKRGNEKMDRYLSGTNPQTALPFTEDDKRRERRENVDLMKGEAAVRLLAIKVEGEQKKLEKVKAMKPAVLVQAAEAEVVRLKADAAKARYAVEACVVKAAGPGKVAQVLADAGAVVYPQSPAPVVVVPAGPRFVRAEVEPEFAHKLAGSEGKAVVVYDNNNFALTYAGTVKRIGSVFLPKRGQGLEALAGNATKVLEVVIEVTDPAPAGKPPLLVGQPVRVSFP
jgi:multidrug resistance efflux pump